MIDLSRCADFVIGPAAVRPSTRELVGADGPLTVEPKVMQVLVALAWADGRVVSRDDLVAQCCRGRIVGDDAINRIIVKLRRALEATAPTARIETIARTGYRLVAPAVAGGNSVAPAQLLLPDVVAAARTALTAARATRPRFFVPLTAVAAVAAALAMVVPWHRLPSTMAPMPQAVTDLETRGLAAMFENTPEQTAEAITYLRQATALAPQSAGVWGSLAMGYVLELGWTPPAGRAAVVGRVRDAAIRGLALDRRSSRSTAALVSLTPTTGSGPRRRLSWLQHSRWPAPTPVL